jgi:hypothetical protein
MSASQVRVCPKCERNITGLGRNTCPYCGHTTGWGWFTAQFFLACVFLGAAIYAGRWIGAGFWRTVARLCLGGLGALFLYSFLAEAVDILRPTVHRKKKRKDVAWLIRVLGHTDLVIRRAAAEALGSIGDKKAVEPLVVLLGDSDQSVQTTAAQALGQIGGERAVTALIRLFREKDRRLRKSATDALASIGTPAVEPLAGVLRKGAPLPRKTTIQLLERLGWDPDRTEAGAVYWAEKRQWDQCVKIGAPSVRPLVRVLQDGTKSMQVRRAAAKALGQIGDAGAIEALLTAIEARDKEMRQTAARALVKIYQTGQLSYTDKQQILAARELITTRHQDRPRHSDQHTDSRRHIDRDDGGCFGDMHESKWIGSTSHSDRPNQHTDSGIGVPFQL